MPDGEKSDAEEINDFDKAIEAVTKQMTKLKKEITDDSAGEDIEKTVKAAERLLRAVEAIQELTKSRDAVIERISDVRRAKTKAAVSLQPEGINNSTGKREGQAEKAESPPSPDAS